MSHLYRLRNLSKLSPWPALRAREPITFCNGSLALETELPIAMKETSCQIRDVLRSAALAAAIMEC